MTCCPQAAEGVAEDPHRREGGDRRPRDVVPPAGGLAAAIRSRQPRAHLQCLCLLKTLTLRRASRSSTRRYELLRVHTCSHTEYQRS